MILLGRASNHLSTLGNLNFLSNGFPSLLLHRVYLFGGDNDVKTIGEAFDIFFDAKWRLYAVEKFSQCIPRLFRERFFSSAEYDLYFDLVSSREEFFRLRSFEIEVMRVGSKTEADAFCFDFLLFALCFLLFLSLGVEVFSVVKDLTHRWCCFWRHFDEIELLLFGASDSLFDGHVFSDGPVRVDDKHKWHSNMLIDARLGKFDDFRLWSSVTTSAHDTWQLTTHNAQPIRISPPEIVGCIRWALVVEVCF